MINDNPILGNQLVVMSRADLDALVEKMRVCQNTQKLTKP